MNNPDLTAKSYGRYHVVGVVARGGMGTVYLARSIGLAGFARTVALKVLHPHLKDEPSVVAMFLAEARLAARIAHRNVVEVLDVDLIDGEHVIAMRYVEGGSLGGLMKGARPGKLPPGIALRIVHDTLLGLHAAHEATSETGEPLAIIHRDVSPPNILVDLEGISQLTDFGVARAQGGLQSTHGSVKGKLRYLAPEQLAGAEMDRRVDVFAAGIVLWELLAGRSLFSGGSDVATMHNVSTLRIDPPEGPSRAIDEVCLRALERDPTRRFATAEEFAAALDAAAGETMARREEVAELARATFGREAEDRREAIAREARSPRSIPPPAASVPPPVPSSSTAASSATIGGVAAATPAPRFSPALIGLIIVVVASIAMVAVARIGMSPPRSADPPAGSALEPVPVSAATAETPNDPPSASETASATTTTTAAVAPRTTPGRRPGRRPAPSARPVPVPGSSTQGPYIPSAL
jgi:eukaryotic-like serine/threonine-protein kinase